jgi:hypothetical protein
MADKRTRKRPAIPANETKAACFVRVATPRVGKALKCIKIIGNCAGTAYEYTPIQAQIITDVLSGAVGELASKLAKKADKSTDFKF